MAKQTRGGLGRGLGSLMGNSYNAESSPEVRDSHEQRAPEQPAPKIIENEKPAAPSPSQTDERERIVFDARGENADKIAESIHPGVTGRFPAVGSETQNINVSRETIHSSAVSNNPRANVTEEAPEDKIPESVNVIMEVDIESVVPNPEQPRTNFKEEDLRELASSIKREGVIQPILVRKADDDTYQIIAGERRWQASKLAGMGKVPIQVKDVSDEKALELALIENIQRTDLNPIEEAYGYRRLMERNKMTQADIAQAVSKGRSTIANALRLLELPEDAQKLLFEDKITAGHARAILSVPDKEGRAKLTRKLAENRLSVRETENLARLMANKPAPKEKKEPMPALYKSVAREMKHVLGTPVKIKSSKGKNKIEIEFIDEKDLERLFGMLIPD